MDSTSLAEIFVQLPNLKIRMEAELTAKFKEQMYTNNFSNKYSYTNRYHESTM